jgi:pimeloyl-ACP methyl ester carboxylesterase
MGQYIDVNGHPTWVEERGSGDEVVLLLHGGLSNTDFLLDSIGSPLAERRRVIANDRRGHGRTPDTPEPFHYDDMATETIGVLEQLVGGPAHLVGWSDGGITGLLVAMRRPDLVNRLVVIGTNFHYDGTGPVEMDDSVIALIANAYAVRSPDGREHFATVLEKTFALFGTEPTMTTDDLASITTATLVMAADDDLVELSHTCALFESLPAGQLAIIPATSHALPVERPDIVASIIIDFLDAALPPKTLMPVRRASAPPDTP